RPRQPPPLAPRNPGAEARLVVRPPPRPLRVQPRDDLVEHLPLRALALVAAALAAAVAATHPPSLPRRSTVGNRSIIPACAGSCSRCRGSPAVGRTTPTACSPTTSPSRATPPAGAPSRRCARTARTSTSAPI